jgi:adenylosuccinate lyase
MIPRYTRPQMAAIWSDQNKYKIWYLIEAHATEKLAELGVVPQSAVAAVWSAKDVEFIAFLTHLGEHVGEQSRFVHQGLTSSDVLDTCLAVQMRDSADLLLQGMDRVLAALKTRAMEHKFTVCIGRSHGIHAEPTTMGLKFARFYAEFKRNRARLVAAREEIATCAISGAIGTFANIDPRVEEHVAAAMGLSVEPISTQVIPRDRHANYFAVLGLIASSIENLAIEVRHLQRSEVREAQEFFAKGQKGSSAMPHKRNPILTENLTGLARLVRSAVIPAMENVALWHERDISHSSVERGIGPDANGHLDFALQRCAGMVEGLIVHADRCQENLDAQGGIHNSQRLLLALTQAGVSREDSYRLVQRNAMKTWDEGGQLSDHLKADPEVTAHMSDAQIEACFDEAYHLKHVDTIFARVFAD